VVIFPENTARTEAVQRTSQTQGEQQFRFQVHNRNTIKPTPWSKVLLEKLTVAVSCL
jgi:hypothetical protein